MVRQGDNSPLGRDGAAATLESGKPVHTTAASSSATASVPISVATGFDPLTASLQAGSGSDSTGSLTKLEGGSGSVDLKAQTNEIGRARQGSLGSKPGISNQQLSNSESGLMAALENNGFSTAGAADLNLDDLGRDSDSVTESLGAFHYVKVCSVQSSRIGFKSCST